jgi:hypothetical protein
LFFGERIMKDKLPSFDELDADQLKELIQSSKKSVKKSKKLPLKEEKPNRKPLRAGDNLEVVF